MAPIKSTSSIARVLRAKTPASNPRVLNTVNRNLTRTAKNATSIESTINSQSSTSTPLLNQDHFQPQYPSHYSPSPIENTIPTNPFSSLVTEITSSLTTTPKPDLPALTKLLRSYTSDPAHWTKFAFPDPNAQYTRNLVAEVPGLFNLLLLVWTPGKASPVHDHAEAHCLMKVLKGSLRERRYAIPTEPGKQGSLNQTSELSFKLNQVSYMADVLGLHEISNPSSEEYAMSLHLYTPPNAAMRGCHVYDLENGKRKHVGPTGWHSVGGVLSRNK